LFSGKNIKPSLKQDQFTLVNTVTVYGNREFILNYVTRLANGSVLAKP